MNEDYLFQISANVLASLQKGMPMLTHTQEQALFLSLLTADIVENLDEGGFLK